MTKRDILHCCLSLKINDHDNLNVNRPFSWNSPQIKQKNIESHSVPNVCVLFLRGGNCFVSYFCCHLVVTLFRQRGGTVGDGGNKGLDEREDFLGLSGNLRLFQPDAILFFLLLLLLLFSANINQRCREQNPRVTLEY